MSKVRQITVEKTIDKSRFGRSKSPVKGISEYFVSFKKSSKQVKFMKNKFTILLRSVSTILSASPEINCFYLNSAPIIASILFSQLCMYS
jgi:hypothetical protein